MTAARGQKRQGIDWQLARERLAQSTEALQGAFTIAPEKARALLKERARDLARPLAQVLAAAETLEILTFSLGNERYAVESRHVQEVVRLTDYTPLPGAPDFLVGIMNLRGDILAVIDLRKFFGLAQQGISDLFRVVVLGNERAEFGILADMAHEVTKARVDDIHEPPGSVSGVGRDYIRGVTKECLIILNGDVLLQDERLTIDQSGNVTGVH